LAATGNCAAAAEARGGSAADLGVPCRRRPPCRRPGAQLEHPRRPIAIDVDDVGNEKGGAPPAWEPIRAPMSLIPADFDTDQEVRWCPSCGDYAILAQLKQVLAELGLPREKFVFVSG